MRSPLLLMFLLPSCVLSIGLPFVLCLLLALRPAPLLSEVLLARPGSTLVPMLRFPIAALGALPLGPGFISAGSVPALLLLPPALPCRPWGLPAGLVGVLALPLFSLILPVFSLCFGNIGMELTLIHVLILTLER